MGWMVRFFTAIVFLAIGVLFSPQTFGSKSDGLQPAALITFSKLVHRLCFSTDFDAALWVTFIGCLIMFKYDPSDDSYRDDMKGNGLIYSTGDILPIWLQASDVAIATYEC